MFAGKSNQSRQLNISVEAGTQGGKILRLKGKGIKEINGYGTGDQLIHVNIWTPKTLSKEETDILEKLKNSPNFAPKPSKGEKSFFEKMKDFFKFKNAAIFSHPLCSRIW